MTLPRTNSLSGTWRLLPVDSFAQGYYPLDDESWIAHEVPGHWQQHPLLERYAGKMVYRTRFPGGGALAPGERAWLRLRGTFYWSQPFLNGVDLGRHEGYFIPQEREVTAWLEEENTLVVEVECPDEHDKLGKRLITGVFSHWDALDPHTNPGGIWLPVELARTGPVRVGGVQLTTERAGDAAAELRYQARLDSAGARDVTLRWTFRPHNFAGPVQTVEERRALADGEQALGGRLTLRDPQLWWTHDMGHPNLYRVTLEVCCEGQPSDAHTVSFGVRTIEMVDWVAYLNGVRLFVKGNNYGPGDARIATMTRAAYDRDMLLAQRCHMNMLRVHAHVEHPEFYEAADEAGILIWQDFPLQWLYQRSIMGEARRQVAEMVRLLYNHPCVAVWCMHNEPIYIAESSDERLLTRARVYASVFLYSWNRDSLDLQLKRDVEALDGTRFAVRSSGEYAIPGWHEGTDGHFYYGWYIYYGKLHTWHRLVRRFPNLIRFVTEFGAQSFPNLESCVRFMDPDIASVDWDHLAERHHFQPHVMRHWLDYRGAASLEELVRLTQDYQVHINRFYIDRLRHAKYRPTGGIVPFMFHDPNPAVQWSVLDYWRVPKRSYHAMRLAFSPQYVFCIVDRPHAKVGAPIELPVYVVNDAHRPVPVSVRVRLTGPGGEELARFERELTLPADCMAIEIERLRLTPTAAGAYTLALELAPAGAEPIANTYEVEARA